MTERFHEDVLREFGEMIGIPALQFDDAGACSFIVDGMHELAILCTRDQLVLTLPITLPDAVMDLPAKQMLAMLPAMTFASLRGESPVVSWHPQTSRPVAIATLPRQLAGAGQLAATTIELLEWCTEWRRTIERAPFHHPNAAHAARSHHRPATHVLC